MLNTFDVIHQSAVKFGTSGARGLVTDFTADVCAAYALSFVTNMQKDFDFDTVAIAIDNRPSSPAMAEACAAVLVQKGLNVVYYGVVPTPALAVASMAAAVPAIMVTGSHIPFDRNGLKFYRPDGEIDKADEQNILAQHIEFAAVTAAQPLDVNPEAAKAYIERYTRLFDQPVLAGKKVGIYEHSSAGRDLYAEIFGKLGAEVISLERSDVFVPIDTEAVSDEDCAKAKAWSEQYQFDFIFSTDGDGDRPLVADEQGQWLRGDILGLLCADALGLEAIAIPVSSNTAIEKSGRFQQVSKTKIGSPYVIEAFATLNEQYASFGGFEANGGFLLGSDVEVNGQNLTALPTRDAVLPAIILLAASQDRPVSALVAELPERYSSSDRIKEFATERSREIIEQGMADPQGLLDKLGYADHSVAAIDTTDGLRITLDNEDIFHLRPSGNAPELRCYAESGCETAAKAYVKHVLAKVQLV
ncbi:phosphomannomutase [Vibrio parahaemolyticus]